MDNCIFCKIVKGEIPSYTLYEDPDFKVILDLNQSMEGHALIIPKTHYSDLFEMPEDLAAASMALAHKLARAAKAGLHCQGLNLLQNNGEIAGQTVMHYHLHVLPRQPRDDSFPLWREKGLLPEEMQAVAQRLQDQLAEG